MLKGVCANLNPGIDFYSGFRTNVCANLNPKNPGIDFYSGFRKNGRCKSEILKNP